MIFGQKLVKNTDETNGQKSSQNVLTPKRNEREEGRCGDQDIDSQNHDADHPWSGDDVHI